MVKICTEHCNMSRARRKFFTSGSSNKPASAQSDQRFAVHTYSAWTLGNLQVENNGSTDLRGSRAGFGESL